MIVCSRGRGLKPAPCHYCSKPSIALCDFYGTILKKTCDRPICGDHRVKIGPNVDHCKVHTEVTKKSEL
jgi:hypothetical protein